MRHPPDRLENSLSITEACSTSRYFGIPKNWRDCHHIHKFPFQVNFDLFTKLFLVVGVCWLFQVCFISRQKKFLSRKYIYFLQTLALLDISALEYIGKIFTLLQVLRVSPNLTIKSSYLYILNVMPHCHGPFIFVVAMVHFMFHTSIKYVCSYCDIWLTGSSDLCGCNVSHQSCLSLQALFLSGNFEGKFFN